MLKCKSFPSKKCKEELRKWLSQQNACWESMRNSVPLPEHICNDRHGPTGFNPSTAEMEQGQPDSTVLKIQAQWKILSQNNRVGNNRGRHTYTHIHKLTRKENANMHICIKENTYTHSHTNMSTHRRKKTQRQRNLRQVSKAYKNRSYDLAWCFVSIPW